MARSWLLSCVFVVLSLFGGGVASAHGPEEDLAELLGAYEKLTASFSAALTNTEGLPAEEIGWLDTGIGRQRVAFNKSVMNQLMVIAAADFDLEGTHCNHTCRKSLLAKIGGVVVGIGRGVVNLPINIAWGVLHPVAAFENAVETERKVSGYSRRILHGYDPTLAILILVTQGAWETLESAFMPAGVHVFCTVFNAALLAAALPLERVAKLASMRHSGLTVGQRLRYSVRSLIWQVKSWWKKNNTLIFDTGEAVAAFNPENMMFKNISEVEEVLIDGGFFPAVYQSRIAAATPGPAHYELAARDETSLQRDLDFVFNPEEKAVERFYVALVHVRGFHLLARQMASMASAARAQGLLSRQSYFALESYTGRMRRVVATYESSLLLFGAAALNDKHGQIKRGYQQLLDQMLSAFSTHAGRLRGLLDRQPSDGAFAAELEEANAEATALIARVRTLRGQPKVSATATACELNYAD